MEIIIPLLEMIAFAVPGVLLVARGLPANERSFIVRTMVIGLALRFVLAALFSQLFDLRVFHEDANGYEGTGMLVASSWMHEAPPTNLEELGTVANGTYPGFLAFCSGVYYVFGRYRLIVTAFTSLMGALSIGLVYRLALTTFHPIVARRAAKFVAYFPSMILWSAMAIKDPVVIFLLLVGLNAAFALRRGVRPGSVLAIVAVLFAIWLVRFYVVYFLLAAIGASLVLVGGRRRLGLGPRIMLALVVIGIMTAVGLTKNLSAGLDKLTLAHAATFRSGMVETANSGFGADADVSTTGGAAAFLPLGLSVLLLGPFPWQMTSFRSLLTLPEMLIWWALVPSVVRGIRFAVRREFAATIPLVVFAGSLCIAYALTLGNVGAAFRQRAQVFVLLFIFAAVGRCVALCRARGIDVDLLRNSRAPADAGT